MSDVVASARGVSKKFCRRLRHSMLYGVQDVARGMLGLGSGSEELRPGEFWAVRDVSFELRRGRTLGLIGPNGSGKSTLLRLLNGIYPPDSGRIEMRGRVGALISVGAGFHPLMTGRENVYLNGAILGMSRRELDRKFERIAEFAGIGDALDAPVKTYSSGMYVRLGFSVAIHCEPDILLVDEILSVGDTSFRNKCMARLRELRDGGAAVVLVSHNLDAVRFMSHEVLAMEDGRIADFGDPPAVIAGYEARTFSRELQARAPEGGIRTVESSGDIRVESARVLAAGGSGPARLECGEGVAVEFVLTFKRRIDSALFGVGILNAAGVVCVWNVSAEDGFEPPPLEGRQRLVARFDGVRLSPGSYEVNLAIRDKATMETLERVGSAAGFCVEGGSRSRGIVRGACAWAVEPL